MVSRKQKATQAESVSNQFGLFPDVELPEPYKKAVSAVHMAPKEGPMTVNQYRVFDALLKHATDQYKVDPARLWYTISIGALSSKIGLESSNNTSYIKNIVDELVTFGVNWDYLAGLNKGEWNTSALLAGAKLSKGGMLSYHYADNLRELFMNPEIWAWVDFRIMKRFSRAATPPVYQNVLRYAGLGKTPALSVDVWRDLILGMDWRKGSYKVYKEFKRAVLQRALDEINTESDHTFELVELKEGGRAVTSLQFIIKEKVKPEVIEASDLDVISAMKKLGVPYSEARKLLAQHSAEAVNAAVSYVEQRQASKLQPIANVPAYFRNALKMGYTVETPQGNEQKALPQSKKANTNTSEEVTALFHADRMAESQRYFVELEPSEQAALVDRFNAQQTSSNLKVASIAKMKKIASTAFFSWLANDTWGEPTDSDMLRFVMEKARVTI
ncbi:replication initiation protein [Paraburkholderia oxyphila]|uniref:replication initiation protein n=1 Tax=Paraburkholderia oxyphila TaxID=614212 RepID=UPI0004821064|nr:replication initiation protein [Paraburkholderia oxyphila]